MVEPVFNDIIPRTRAQRVSGHSIDWLWSKAKWTRDSLISLLLIICCFCDECRLPWKTKNWLRIRGFASAQAVTTNMWTRPRCTTQTQPRVTSSPSRSASIKISRSQTREFASSSSSMCRIDGHIWEKRDSRERLVDLKTWSQAMSNRHKCSKSRRTSSMQERKIRAALPTISSTTTTIKTRTATTCKLTTTTAVFAHLCAPRTSMIRAMGRTIFSPVRTEAGFRFRSTNVTTRLRMRASRSCDHQTHDNLSRPPRAPSQVFSEASVRGS